MCTSPKHDVGLSLWPVSLKVFGCYSNLEENVSNNFKYSYLIYWAFMFLPQMGCYGLRRNLRRDYIGLYMHFLSNLNHDKKLVSEIDCSCRYIIFLNQCICLAQHWTLYITCWRLSHIWYKKSELKYKPPYVTFGEEQYEMIWCKKKKTKAYVKWCRPT